MKDVSQGKVRYARALISRVLRMELIRIESEVMPSDLVGTK